MQHLHFQYFLGHADRRKQPPTQQSRKKRKPAAGGLSQLDSTTGPPSARCCLPLFNLQSQGQRDVGGRKYKASQRDMHHNKTRRTNQEQHQLDDDRNKKRIARPEAGESPACKAARGMFVQGNLTQDELIRVIQADDLYIRKESRATVIHSEVDRITLEPLGEHQFLFVRPNGSVIRYNAESLAEYFLVSGCFFEPESRIAVTEKDLLRLDKQLAAARIKKPSVLAAFKNGASEYKEQALERDLVDGLDRCTGEVVEQMLAVVEENDGDSAQMKLYLDLFPQFTGWFTQLLQVDVTYAAQCLEQYTSLISGPPNKPIAAKCFGIKRCVLNFLKSQQKLRPATNPANSKV